MLERQSLFWFGNEDADHIESILHRYSAFLGVYTERIGNSRRPLEFIGAVIRTIHSTETSQLITHDTVQVYLRDFVPIGQTMLPQWSAYVSTTWDSESGLPLAFRYLTGDETMDHRELSSFCQTSNLYCFPVAYKEDQYIYKTCHNMQDIVYADSLRTCISKSLSLLKPTPSHLSSEEDEDHDDAFDSASSSDADSHDIENEAEQLFSELFGADCTNDMLQEHLI